MALERLIPRGLRWRLAAAVAAVMTISFAITFLAVYRGTSSELGHQIDRELSSDAEALARFIRLSGARSPQAVAAAAASYVHNQPFGPSSTLLFVTVPGLITATNRPELFGSALPDNGESGAEQRAENRLAGRLRGSGSGFHTLPLPDVGDLRLLKRTITVGRDVSATVGVGEPLAAIAHAQHSVTRSFILAGILTSAAGLLAALLLGSHFSRPLRRMAAVAARVDAGDLHPRIEDLPTAASEVRVLADAFNHMLDRLTAAFAGQRAFVADASHELRTPLTVISGQLEVLAADPNPSTREVRRVERLVRSEIGRITRLVDDLLLLAKSEQTEFLRVADIDLASYLPELWHGMAATADRRFELGELPSGILRADPDRIAQALRNVIANAIDHTEPHTGHVALAVRGLPGHRVAFTVSDNGPGIAADQRERVFDRFYRTDEGRDRASGGAGLGLAIVRAIALAHGGTVRAYQTPGGGAAIELVLPRFVAENAGGPLSAAERSAI